MPLLSFISSLDDSGNPPIYSRVLYIRLRKTTPAGVPIIIRKHTAITKTPQLIKAAGFAMQLKEMRKVIRRPRQRGGYNK